VTESNIILEQSFKYHERAIKKIHFHPYDTNTLISGGQDGIIKLIDFRLRAELSTVSVFKHDAEEKVTDLKFNPSSSMSYQFASGSENGNAFVFICV
jgi:WD40 repeat protein